jgi:CubicO group peptidase (beta-lactamase class C family)
LFIAPKTLHPDFAAASPISQPGLAKTCAFEAFVRIHVLGTLGAKELCRSLASLPSICPDHVAVFLCAAGMPSTTFLPVEDMWPNSLPSWNDSTYRHIAVQGRVSDENSYALGGIAGGVTFFRMSVIGECWLCQLLLVFFISLSYNHFQVKVSLLSQSCPFAGHAGVFSSARDMITGFARMWMYGPQFAETEAGPAASPSSSAPPPPPVSFLNTSTVALFTSAPNATFSPRALGWLTQAPSDTYQGCGRFAPTTFYHTGYTGTLLCADPTRNITTVLLTNRVWPNRSELQQIQATRQAFNDAVLEVLGA